MTHLTREGIIRQLSSRRLMRNIFHIKVEKGQYEITGEAIYNRSVLVIRKLYLNTLKIIYELYVIGR